MTPFFSVYGDPDDQYRLVALLAHHFAAVDPKLSWTCLHPYTKGWSVRLEALRGLFVKTGERPKAERPKAVKIYGLEHLDTRKDWRDHAGANERAELAFVLRVGRDKGLLSFATDGVRKRSANVVAMYPRDLQPLVTWLLESRTATEKTLRENVGHPDRVLQLAFCTLTPKMAEAATRLSAVRHPMWYSYHWLGSFHLGDYEPSDTWGNISRYTVMELLHRGFLVPVPGHTRQCWFPPTIRKFFRAHARALEPAVLLSDHRWLATCTTSDARAPWEKLERHHHAVQSLDVDLALSTVTTYVSDLHELGQALLAQERYEEARRVYREMADHESSERAWAGLAYACVPPGLSPTPELTQWAMEAVTKGFLATVIGYPDPLFIGFAVAFLQMLGADPGGTFDCWVRVYGRVPPPKNGGPTALAIFARSLYESLDVRGYHNTYRSLCERWASNGEITHVLLRASTNEGCLVGSWCNTANTESKDKD